MKTIMLLNINVDTLKDKTFLDATSDQRLNFLQRNLDELKKCLPPETQKQVIRGIIIAPEYFFAKSHKVGKIRQLPAPEARYIETKLAAISKRYPQILIIPGTIAWTKKTPQMAPQLPPPPLPMGVNKSAFASVVANCAPVPAKAKGLSIEEYKKYKKERGVEFKEADYYQYMQKFADSAVTGGIIALKKPGVSQNCGHANQGAPRNDPQAKLSTLNNTQLEDLLLSRNTAYFYLNGYRVYKYHKCSDYQEVLDKKPNVFIPGVKPPIKIIDGISFGIEICLDHDCGVLSKFLDKNSGLFDYSKIADANGVDIHLILSAVVENKSQNVKAKPNGGYLIHSSSFFDYNKCNRNRINKKQGIEEIKPTKQSINNIVYKLSI